jgi:hypothetical protein
MHFLFMCAFAAVVAGIEVLIDAERREPRARALYGLKVFGAFVGIGVLLGWLMRFVPF